MGDLGGTKVATGAKKRSSMEKVIQENAADAEETASSSEEMSAQAETLKAFIGQLVSLVGNRKNNNGAGDCASHWKR